MDDLLLRHLLGQLSRTYSLSDEALFHHEVIFFLSLMLLILVHLGYRLADAFELPDVPLARPETKPEGRAWWRR